MYMNQSSYLIGKPFVDIIGLLCSLARNFARVCFANVYGSLVHEKESGCQYIRIRTKVGRTEFPRSFVIRAGPNRNDSWLTNCN